MKSVLFYFSFFLLFNLDLYADVGNNSTLPLIQSHNKDASILHFKDFSGKSIIIWENKSTISLLHNQVFVQRMDEYGEMIWRTPVELTVDTIRIQNSHQVTSDSQGGAIITWEERSFDNDETDILAQRIDSSGNKLWGPKGIVICAASGSQITPMLAADNAGGAVIVWTDSRNDLSYTNWDIYAQRIDSEGRLIWNEDGIVVSSDIKDEYVGKVLADSNGNITVIWNKVLSDFAGISEGYEFYFRKFDSKGEWVQVLNNENFLTLPASSTNYTLVGDILSDSNNGFFLSLTMNKYESDTSLYLQHVLADGNLSFIGDYGLLIDNSISDQNSITFKQDSTGTAIIQWQKTVDTTTMVYALRFEKNSDNTYTFLIDSELDEINRIDRNQNLYGRPEDTLTFARVNQKELSSKPIFISASRKKATTLLQKDYLQATTYSRKDSFIQQYNSVINPEQNLDDLTLNQTSVNTFKSSESSLYTENIKTSSSVAPTNALKNDVISNTIRLSSEQNLSLEFFTEGIFDIPLSPDGGQKNEKSRAIRSYSSYNLMSSG